MRELVLQALEPCVEVVSDLCLHSLRVGAAIAAVNAAIPDKLFKRHGPWLIKDAKKMGISRIRLTSFGDTLFIRFIIHIVAPCRFLYFSPLYIKYLINAYCCFI